MKLQIPKPGEIWHYIYNNDNVNINNIVSTLPLSVNINDNTYDNQENFLSSWMTTGFFRKIK